jgi:hypothetical protein
MKASIAHASMGFALAVGLWSLNALPSAWPDDRLGELQARHGQENTAAIQLELAGE